jgi:hypothetical protein
MSLHTTTYACHNLKERTRWVLVKESNSLEGYCSNLPGVSDLEKGTGGSSRQCLGKLMALIVAAMAAS